MKVVKEEAKEEETKSEIKDDIKMNEEVEEEMNEFLVEEEKFKNETRSETYLTRIKEGEKNWWDQLTLEKKPQS